MKARLFVSKSGKEAFFGDIHFANEPKEGGPFLFDSSHGLCLTRDAHNVKKEGRDITFDSPAGVAYRLELETSS